MVRGLQSLWGTTTRGIGLRLRSPKIRRAGKRTHCFFRIMSTYSCRRKLTCCRADWCGPRMMASLFSCIVQGADWVGTGAPLTRNLLIKWAARCGKVLTSWWRSPTGSLLRCTKSSQLLDDCRVFSASSTRASNSSAGGGSGSLLAMAPSLAGDLVPGSLDLGRLVGGTSDGDGFEWRDFRVDPDGLLLGAASRALVVVGVSFGKVEGAGAIAVTSDGAPLGAGSGLDKLLALDGTTLGVGPGAGKVVAAADRTCLGTSGGNRGNGVLLGYHEGASAPRALTVGPRMEHCGSLDGGAWRHRDWPPVGQSPARGWDLPPGPRMAPDLEGFWGALRGYLRWGLGWHHYESLAGGAGRYRNW
jgi:hypothetical protein